MIRNVVADPAAVTKEQWRDILRMLRRAERAGAGLRPSDRVRHARQVVV
jgi:hypothetical protein